MTILIGTHVHPASEEGQRRQERALHSLRALGGVELVNLQFARTWTPIAVDGFETLPVLEHDSLTATGARGIRKPLMGEVCVTLAAEARRRGSGYFCFTNADILFSQEAVDEMRAGRREGYAFSRMDVDAAAGVEEQINLGGVDAIAARPAWWLANARRFRQFIVGESLWDQMYTSILLRHADAVLFNLRPLIRHSTHPVAWSEHGAFASYNGFLAALDSPYFSLWCEYHAAREAWVRQGGSEAQHFAMQRAAFTRPWHRGTWTLQLLRRARAWARYHRSRVDDRRALAAKP
jgi:hypothetical protein